MTSVQARPGPPGLLALAVAVLSLRPLAEACSPLPWPAGHGEPACAALAVRLAERAGLDPAVGAGDLRLAGIVEGVLKAHQIRDASAEASDAELDLLLAQAAAAGFDAMRCPGEVAVPGARLRTYAAGDPSRPCIVLASACGMPARLCEPWMRFLSATHRVVTWETRGLFGGPVTAEAFDAGDCSLAQQGADLLAVMDHHEIGSAHVMGMCGGAVIALSTAAAAPERVSSLSLWHGDFSGSPGPVTDHQANLKALMAMAAGGRQDASAINGALAQTALSGVPPELAHLVGYPYLTDELFYRYCVLTGATMTTDVSPLLEKVSQPALVVTSRDDRTAHPGGSLRAAELLANATLRVEDRGDHISAFGAGDGLRGLLVDFLTETADSR